MTDQELKDRLKGRDPLAELEAWNSGHKARSVQINIDDGYGATCWTVRLSGEDKRVVDAAECSFFCYRKEDVPAYMVILVKGDEPWMAGGEWEKWPGLGPVILAAIDRWNAR